MVTPHENLGRCGSWRAGAAAAFTSAFVPPRGVGGQRGRATRDAGAYKHNSFDLILQRNDEIKHAEVKGAT